MDQKLGYTQVNTLQHIIDNLPVVVFEYTIFPDGSRDFTYLSPRCEEILGVKRELLLTGVLPMRDFFYTPDWESFKRQRDKSIDKLTELNWEGRINCGSKLKWIEVQGKPYLFEEGTIVCSGVIMDISKRKAVELREKVIEKEYKNLLEFLPIGIGIHAKGKILYVNKYASEMLGAKSSSELVGADVLNLVHPDFRQMVSERVKSVIAGNAVPQVEEKYLRLDGTPINVLSSALPVTIAGEPAVQNIVINITGQRETEAEIRKAEMLFTQLFDNTPLAIAMLDSVGKVVNVNRGFEEMFGFSLSEVKGSVLDTFIVPDELEEEGSDLNTLISSKKVIRIESIRKTRENKSLSVIIYGVPVKMEDETIGIFGLYVDITEGKKVEEELKVRNTELDNFVYKVSHDLRAPLSSILGLVNLAKLPNNTDSLDQYLDIVGKKATQLDHFIGDVLSHSKNLKMKIKVGRIDFQKIIDDSFLDLTYLAGAEQVQQKIAVSGIDFHSDQWRVKEIFRNLISNAIKYRNKENDCVIISIDIKVDPNNATIVFSDNGIGIDEDKVDNIFEMFYRASETSTGSGLGLYIVKNAIEKLNGSIAVESSSQLGTTFKIKLPNVQ